MTKPQWKDATSYRKGETDKEPTTWTLRLDGVYVAITKSHIYYKGTWIMSFEPWFKHMEVGPAENFTAEQVQDLAARKAMDALRDTHNALRSLLYPGEI